TLGVCHGEIAVLLLLGMARLLMANYHDLFAMEARDPANNRWIVGKAAVAVNFAPVGKNPLDVVESVRTLRMPRQFGFLPRRQVGCNPLPQSVDTLMQVPDLPSRAFVLADGFHPGNLLLDLAEFLLCFGSRFHAVAITVARDPARFHHRKQELGSGHN